MNICGGSDKNDAPLDENFDEKILLLISQRQFEFDGHYRLIKDEGDEELNSRKKEIEELKQKIQLKEDKIDNLKKKIKDLDLKLKNMYKVIIMDDKEQQFIDTLGKFQNQE